MIIAAAGFIAGDAGEGNPPARSVGGVHARGPRRGHRGQEALFRLVRRAAGETGSTAVHTDAWHHRVDAITSLAALCGISLSLLAGPGWEAAEDWAALLAACIIAFNGFSLLLPPLRELLDAQATDVVEVVTAHAAKVPGVVHVQKAYARRSGREVWIDMHIWVDGAMNVARRPHPGPCG
jgi:cation diffusion facilitator family transporter